MGERIPRRKPKSAGGEFFGDDVSIGAGAPSSINCDWGAIVQQSQPALARRPTGAEVEEKSIGSNGKEAHEVFGVMLV
jgi:hypothetical protein